MIFQVFGCSNNRAVVELFWASWHENNDNCKGKSDIYPSSLGRISIGISFWSAAKSVPWNTRTSCDLFVLICWEIYWGFTLALSLKKGFTTVISIPKILQRKKNNLSQKEWWWQKIKILSCFHFSEFYHLPWSLLWLVHKMDSPDPQWKKSTEKSWSKTDLINSEVPVRRNIDYHPWHFSPTWCVWRRIHRSQATSSDRRSGSSFPVKIFQQYCGTHDDFLS